VPDITCGEPVEELAAYLDEANPVSQRNGDFHCFCSNLLNSKGYKYVINYRFSQAPENEPGDLCYDWFLSYAAISTAMIAIPGVVCLVNILTEVFVGFASTLRRPITRTRNVIDSIFGVTLIQFINLALVLVVANVNMKFKGAGSFLGMFDGDYDDFSTPWYSSVGPQIIMTMLIEIAAPHFFPAFLIVLYAVRRCWDRSCTCDRRRTKMNVQSRYE
jgi:hypothetical protein